MAYTKQTWTDGVSQVNAARLSYIETGIDEAHDLAEAAGGGSSLPAGGTTDDYLRGDESWQPLADAAPILDALGAAADATAAVNTATEGLVTYTATTPHTVNNSTNLTADPYMPPVPVAANTRYQLDIYLLWTLAAGAGSGVDVRLDFTFPSGTAGYWESMMVSWQQPGALGAQTGMMKDFGSATDGQRIVAQALTSGTQATSLRAIIATGSTAGDLVLRWGQNTAAAFDLTRLAGSNILARRLT